MAEMSSYAALVSLAHTLHYILRPPPLNNIIIDKEQIKFLEGKVSFLIDLLETCPTGRSQEVADLEKKIRDVAYAAEDVIESYVVEQILTIDGGKPCALLCEGIQTLVTKFISIEEELMKIKEKKAEEDLQPRNCTTVSASKPLLGGKITRVGLEEHVNEIMGALTTHESNRQIIPIVGMGGIGKTTLATAVYNNHYIIEHFGVCAWITISQEYIVGELLLRLLSEITKACQNKQEMDDDEVGELLYKELYGRKYLIVMDDMWDIEAWDKVRRFVPCNNNGSRILVTTRLSNLADAFRSCSPYQIGLLDEEKSWDLLRIKVFDKEDCPIELEEIGKNIARKCQGLPLALVVIGGILAKSEKTREHWGSVFGDVTSAVNCGSDEHLMEILSLSYNHLPIYLKPCFAYLAVFPEDFEICVSLLVKMWVAEGLIKPTQIKLLEQVALEYVEELINRNLILVHERGSTGKVKYCKIHDILRELCIKKADKERFIYIAELDKPITSPNMETKRRLSVPSSVPQEIMETEHLELARFNRSWLSHNKLLRYFWRDRDGYMSVFPEEVEMVSRIIHGFRLLKVLHVNDFNIQIDILKLNNLRHAVAWSVSSISYMSLCWNLQTLVVLNGGVITLPVEIWQMPQLRHLKMEASRTRATLPDPPPSDQTVIVLENLQTLAAIENFKCTEDVLERIPNLNKLGIKYRVGHDDYCPENLVWLEKLESLRIHGGSNLWMDIVLPVSLKKLALRGCKIPWESLSIVGSLPNLEVLKLHPRATKGAEWSPVEGEFCRLKYLLMWGPELRILHANNSNFPCLEHIVLAYVKLKKIPKSFAKILTLKVMELCGVDQSIWISARKILDKQEQLGYEPLLLRRYKGWE